MFLSTNSWISWKKTAKTVNLHSFIKNIKSLHPQFLHLFLIQGVLLLPLEIPFNMLHKNSCQSFPLIFNINLNIHLIFLYWRLINFCYSNTSYYRFFIIIAKCYWIVVFFSISKTSCLFAGICITFLFWVAHVKKRLLELRFFTSNKYIDSLIVSLVGLRAAINERLLYIYMAVVIFNLIKTIYYFISVF